MYKHKTFVKTNRKDLAVIGTALARLWTTEMESTRLVVSQIVHHLVVDDKDMFTDMFDGLVELTKTHRVPMNFKADGPKFETTISRPAIIVKMFQLQNLDINLVLSYIDNESYNSDMNEVKPVEEINENSKIDQLTNIVSSLVEMQVNQTKANNEQLDELTTAIQELTKRVDANDASNKNAIRKLSASLSKVSDVAKTETKTVASLINANTSRKRSQKNSQPSPSSY